MVFLLSVAGEGARAVSLFAGVVASLLVATLRFKRARRFEFVQENCAPTALVGRVCRGRVRGGRPFYVAVPTCAHPHRPLFHALMGELRRHSPGARYLAPDVQVTRGQGETHVVTQGVEAESVVMTKPMSCAKFSACLRFLLTCLPLS